MSDKSPAFRFYARDFLTSEKQNDMSLLEAGAYIRLMCHCWLNGSLPDDLGKLAQRAGATDGQMKKFWPAISKCFEKGEDGRWYHPRLEDERRRQASYRERQSLNGKKGGRPPQKETQALSEINAEPVKIPVSQNPLASASANATVRSSSLERGLEKTFQCDVAFNRLKQAYPQQRITTGHVTVTAFVDALMKAAEGPAAAFERMMSNLETQVHGHEWRTKGYIPKLENWLTSGAWEQRHDAQPPVAEQLAPKTNRTLQAATDLMRGRA